ncbi:MAG: RusA family crossover junction endodeoxyribonuclease [Endomicrobium sp.]|jgi:Holliday junction resolvase RusA-like endonuclease|nr:RusA family crossover junction endodeoxyribonuclease [Endomicrobium sp.]
MENDIYIECDLKISTANRPRVSKGGYTYYAKTYQKFRKDFKAFLKSKYPNILFKHKEDKGLFVVINVYTHANKLKAIEYSTSRKDVDNIAKSILDGMNEVIYDDDSQVCILCISKFNTPRDTSFTIFVKEFNKNVQICN